MTVRRGATRQRRGTILVCALACVIVVIGIGGASVRLALQAHRAARTQHQLTQTQWLMEAGIHRAQQALAERGRDYQGERWAAPVSHMAGRTASVEISIERLNPSELDQEVSVGVTALIRPADELSTGTVTQRSYRFLATVAGK